MYQIPHSGNWAAPMANSSQPATEIGNKMGNKNLTPIQLFTFQLTAYHWRLQGNKFRCI